MQKLTALFLLIIVAGSTFNKAIALIDYRVNKNYIAATLCENRNKPSCHCQGKCYLKKQLQKEESDKNSQASREKFEMQWFFQKAASGNELVRNPYKSDFYVFQDDTCFGASSSIFRPPCLS